MADNRPSAYEENGCWIYRASAVGGSSHVLAAARAGYTPISGDTKWTERRDQYMAEGVLHEPDIIARVAADGFEMSHVGDDDQLELTYELTPTIAVRVHPDGIAQARHGPAARPVVSQFVEFDIQVSQEFVLEAKAFSKDVYKTWSSRGFDSPSFRRYAYQLSIQMLATNLPGIFATKNRDNGEVTWTVYPDPPISRADILRRLLRIDKGARDGDLNPLNEKCTEFPCPYYFLHGDTIEQEDGDATNGFTIIEDDMLDALCQTLDEAREREKMAKAAMDTARARINELLGTRNEVHTGRYTMKRIVRETKKIDGDLLKKDGIDPVKYMVVTMGQQLRVTGRDQ